MEKILVKKNQCNILTDCREDSLKYNIETIASEVNKVFNLMNNFKDIEGNPENIDNLEYIWENIVEIKDMNLLYLRSNDWIESSKRIAYNCYMHYLLFNSKFTIKETLPMLTTMHRLLFVQVNLEPITLYAEIKDTKDIKITIDKGNLYIEYPEDKNEVITYHKYLIIDENTIILSNNEYKYQSKATKIWYKTGGFGIPQTLSDDSNNLVIYFQFKGRNLIIKINKRYKSFTIKEFSKNNLDENSKHSWIDFLYSYLETNSYLTLPQLKVKFALINNEKETVEEYTNTTNINKIINEKINELFSIETLREYDIFQKVALIFDEIELSFEDYKNNIYNSIGHIKSNWN